MDVRHPLTGLNFYAWAIESFIFEGTMRGLFSILFGAGTLLLIDRLEKNNKGLLPADIYYRRLLWLLVFGLINAFVFLWPGDILYPYALTGLLIFPFRILSPKKLLIVAFVALLIPTCLYTSKLYDRKEVIVKGRAAEAMVAKKQTINDEQKEMLGKWSDFKKNASKDSLPARLAEEEKKIVHKSYAEIFKYYKDVNVNLQSTGFYYGFWDMLIFFLIGMALFKSGFIVGTLSTRLYVITAVVGTGIGLWLNYIDLSALYKLQFDRIKFTEQSKMDLYEIRRVFQTIGYLSILILLYKLSIVKKVFHIFAPVGQMAFTNYLSQSIITSIVFYGFGLFATLQRYQLYYVVFSIWIFQIIFSHIWLRYFRLGPLEMLWRSLTYWQKQSLKKETMAVTKPLLTVFLSLILLTSTRVDAQKKETLNTSLAAYEKYIDANNDTHLKEFTELVAIPSISSIPANKLYVENAANWIVNKLKAIGITTAQKIPTNGNPVVYASWYKAPGKPTVLIYAHYDVQPVKEPEWDKPPFAPTIKDGKLFGRGASDDKSGVMIPIWAIEAMVQKDGKLPLNVKLVFEGEEEVGSPNFRKFLETNKNLLKADFAVTADDDQFSESQPAIILSTRGSVQFEFTVKTANTDAHSGQFGGKTPNAVVAMSQIISSFHDKTGNVAVEGFYDKVLPITAQQKEVIKKIPYSPEDDMKILGTTLEVGDTTYSPLERVWYRPTLEVIGMYGGYTAAVGHSNIIPGSATAKITCRLVNNQNGFEINQLLIKHINKVSPKGARVSFKYDSSFASPNTTPTDTKAYQYVADALLQGYGKEPFKMGAGGTGGAMISLKEVLGTPAYSLGFLLPDEKWHASNEFFRLSSIRKGQLIYCYYLQHVADEESKLKK
jgi:acetylornithine deacetylase/succinyl-diaminopimelate desuccinylase-like protein/uncharacterized membrane protein YeiB